MIKGLKLVTDIYGNWPSFHDAEIVSFNLYRCTERNTANASMELNYYEVRTENAGTVDFEVVKTKNNIIKISLESIVESSIEDFNHQNVIEEISFAENDGLISVDIVGSFGVDIKISCKSVNVESVVGV